MFWSCWLVCLFVWLFVRILKLNIISFCLGPISRCSGFWFGSRIRITIRIAWLCMTPLPCLTELCVSGQAKVQSIHFGGGLLSLTDCLVYECSPNVGWMMRSVKDSDPVLKQHWVNVSCVLGHNNKWRFDNSPRLRCVYDLTNCPDNWNNSEEPTRKPHQSDPVIREQHLPSQRGWLYTRPASVDIGPTLSRRVCPSGPSIRPLKCKARVYTARDLLMCLHFAPCILRKQTTPAANIGPSSTRCRIDSPHASPSLSRHWVVFYWRGTLIASRRPAL